MVSNVQKANEKVFDLHGSSEKGNLKPHHKTLRIPRMTKIKITNNTTYCQVYVAIGTLSRYW